MKIIDRIAPTPITRSRAWATLLILFTLAWGIGVWSAIKLRISPNTPASDPLLTAFLGIVPPAIATSIAIAMYYRYLQTYNYLGQPISASETPRTPWFARSQFLAGAAYVGLIGFGFIVGQLISKLPFWDLIPIFGQSQSFPTGDQTLFGTVVALTLATLAGLSEEFILVALPTVMLRAAGVNWKGAVTALVLLRVSFHLYYGLPINIGIAIWALLAIWFYLRTGRIWAMAIAHSIWDIGTVLQLMNPVADTAFNWIKGMCIAFAVIVLIASMVKRK